MEIRSIQFLETSYYLSKFGIKTLADNYPSPPSRLNVDNWTEAYRIFYEKLSGGRSILAFERSLKNARDAFDSHLQSSGRIGWRADDRKPNPLGKSARKVLEYLNSMTEQEIWNRIKNFANLDIKEYSQTIKDIISIQESEEITNTSKTEGGIKMVTSIVYERSFSLRTSAIKNRGLNCMVCGFNYFDTYGSWGKDFIEVHHVNKLAENTGKELLTNPLTDLVTVCANCHRMIHRKKGVTLTIEELKKKLKKHEGGEA